MNDDTLLMIAVMLLLGAFIVWAFPKLGEYFVFLLAH